MSNLSIKRLQVGNSTAGNNFVIAQPDVADGTMRIYNGNIGSVTEKLRIDNAGRVICANGGAVNTNLTATDAAFMFDYEPSRNAWASTANDGAKTHALHVRTPVLDSTNVDAIVIAESGGQASGRNSLAFWNEDYSGGTGYRKARIYTEVGSSYTATAFYIDVADSSRVMQNRFRIDSAGRVNIPNQTMFSAWNVGGTTISGNVILNTVLVDTGGNYSTSTGRFTAPIAGKYMFHFSGFMEANATSGDISLNKNGGQFVRTYSNEATGVYRPFAISCIATMAAGDYMQPNAVANLHGNANPVFSGYLVG